MSLFERVRDRVTQAWPSVLLAAATATASWEASAVLPGHDRPSFAAIVCLCPGLSSRGRQAVGLLVGVPTGVANGAVLQSLGAGHVYGIFGSAALSMLAAAAVGHDDVADSATGIARWTVLGRFRAREVAGVCRAVGPGGRPRRRGAPGRSATASSPVIRCSSDGLAMRMSASSCVRLIRPGRSEAAVT